MYQNKYHREDGKSSSGQVRSMQVWQLTALNDRVENRLHITSPFSTVRSEVITTSDDTIQMIM